MNKEKPPVGADEAEQERLDDEALVKVVKERANQRTIPVSLDELLELGKRRTE
jgi:hypothetical protein